MELKPEWMALPEAFRQAVERRFNSPIATVANVNGGFSSSGSYRLQFESGLELFCKLEHPANTEIARDNFLSELARVLTITQINSHAPRFLTDLGIDGYHAMFFEFIEDREPVPPWTDSSIALIFDRMSRLHSSDATEFFAKAKLASGREIPNIKFAPRMYWAELLADPARREALAALSIDPRTMMTWLSDNEARIAEAEALSARVAWQTGPIHLDLRSDNILISRTRGALFVDWPYLCEGPRLVDLGFLLPSLDLESGLSPEAAIDRYEQIARVKFPKAERLCAAALISGFYAWNAALPPDILVPRVRALQRELVKPALRWFSRELEVNEPDRSR